LNAVDLESLARAAEAAPGVAEPWFEWGSALLAAGRASDAAQALLRAVRLKPSWAAASSSLASALDALGELEGALTCLERATELEPKVAAWRRQLAFAFVRLGRPEEAVRHYQHAMALDEQDLQVVLELAAVVRALGRVDSAVSLYRKALRLEPTLADVHNDLGNALYAQGKVDEAIDAYRGALEHHPSLAAAHGNLGNALKDVGLHDEAIACYRRALELAPDDAVLHGSLLFVLAFHPDYDAERLLEEAKSFGRRHTEPLRPERAPHDNERSASRRLRVGYVSSDLREHVSRFYLDGLLRHHDRAAVEVFCYSNTFPGDAWTARYRELASVFRDVWSLDDAELSRLIRADAVDVLVDLTMHSGSARPLVFARKPAPVQIGWLGYVGTTGNDAMDYRITDPYLDPLDAGTYPYTERPLRLPHSFWCYDPQAPGTRVAPLPALRNGYLTFGSFGSFCKVTEPSLDSWSEVLRAVPDARFVLHAPAGSARARVLESLERRGVAASRVTLRAHQPRAKYLSAYDDVDLCLDTLPYNGLSNTLDAAWMGVPTLTLVGASVVGRAAYSVAANLGLSSLASRTPAEVVDTARRFASDLPGLSELRAGLRARLQSSPLMDAPRFARDMESAYRAAWKAWCDEPA
jgi:protein O-GlcNAc transferase